MKKTFKYGKLDRRAKVLTVIWLFVFAIVFFVVWFFWREGGYVMAWTTALLLAVLVLYLMSIPYKIVVHESYLEIRCLVEVTNIKYSEMSGVRRMEKREMKHKYVLLGSYGLFGYYGYYFDRDRWETLKLYCTEWNNFVEIIDMYEKRYVVSCQEPDALIEAINKAALDYSEKQSV